MSPAPARIDELKKRYEENPRRFFAPLANEYRKSGDLDAAIDLCRMHLEEQPGHLSGHIVYGQALYESQRPADAKAAFESALTLDPENLIALRHLGDIARAASDAGTATHWYQRVLDADPRNDEVIALIASLQEAPPPPNVVITEDAPPPPAPQYAENAEGAAAIDHAAPTPIIPISAVPSEPAVAEPPAGVPRMSIGLMDLDLNLADSTAPTVDFLGSAPTDESPTLGDFQLPAPDDTAPAFEEGFPIADAALPTAGDESPELLGADDTNLGLAGPDGMLEVHDTSFGAEQIVEDDGAMFGAAAAAPSFGDSLDVTAADFEPQERAAAEPLDALPMLDTGSREPIAEPITSVSAMSAPPAPATAGDFDMLFGNTPIGDVQVGGDSAPASPDGAGFTADSFFGREPSDEQLGAAPDIATPPSPFVTETMAELYLQQGFREEALSVYRQLLAQNPGDAGLAERVKHLEHGSRSSMAIDSVSEEIEAAAAEEERRLTGSIPTVPAEPVVPMEAEPMIPSEPEPAVPEPAPAYEFVPPADEPAPPAFEAAPSAVEPVFEPAPALAPEPIPELAPEPAAELAPEPAPELASEPTAGPTLEPTPAPMLAPTPAVSVAASSGPTARDLLARIAQRRAVPGGGLALPVAEVPPADTQSPEPVSPPQGEPPAVGGALDRLFGQTGVGTVDEGAALAVSAAFVAAPEAPVQGEPTRRGTDELSLDSVFKGDAAARPAAVQRQSTKLRFDQFFAGTDDGAVAPPPEPAAPGKGPDDIAQFNDWLKGLKGS